MVAGLNNEWVNLSDSGDESDREKVVMKKCSKVYKTPSNKKSDEDYAQKYSKSLACGKNVSDGFIDNIFTLFDKVKLESKKHQGKGPKGSLPCKNGMKTLSFDPQETYKTINSTLKCREMHLKRQFSQMCVQSKNEDINRPKISSESKNKNSNITLKVQGFERPRYRK
ncbi:uncharacterized protein LOC108904896 [Anoplophora glabripennis]|uniref:uncharacterized protein LOC108904896 n=1 Tax=Anoplophora glabripennis TaxID=217634 RepID=UPI000874378E|nr:uncharacterized protein LOC108904896 [Anoplophora glabripennis]